MTRLKTFTRIGVAAAMAATALTAVPASAQQSANVNHFVITGEAAKRALTTNEISLATAKQIGEGTIACAVERKKAVTVFILAPSGEIVWQQRMDGMGPSNIDTAHMKAKTALYMRAQTAQWATIHNNNLQAEVRRIPLGQFWTPGGLPIIVDDVLIGAIGIGGSNADAECAHEAMTKVLGPNIPKLIPPPPATQPFPRDREPAAAPPR